MKLVNHTPFPALLELGSTTDHEQLGTVVCKVSYQWFDGGDLYPLPTDSMWPVHRAPAMFQGTTLLPDGDFRREGIDVLLFGDAIAPGGQPVAALQAGVASGSFLRHIDVLGDRIIMGHAKDRTADGEFVTAGTGVLDYRHYFGRLRAVGFDGDMITHGLTADVAPAVAAFLSRMLQ